MEKPFPPPFNFLNICSQSHPLLREFTVSPLQLERKPCENAKPTDAKATTDKNTSMMHLDSALNSSNCFHCFSSSSSYKVPLLLLKCYLEIYTHIYIFFPIFALDWSTPTSCYVRWM